MRASRRSHAPIDGSTHFFDTSAQRATKGNSMNKSYKSIWNEALGAWVAASELCKTRGKSSCSSKGIDGPSAPGVGGRSAFSLLACAALTALGLAASGQAAAQLFVNDGTDGICTMVQDTTTGNYVLQVTGDPNACGANHATQTTHSSFYGVPGRQAVNLAVGGELYVNTAAHISNLDMRNTKITNVAAGTLSATSTDGVNASQLYATNLAIAAINTSNPYFKANSVLADASAIGTDAIAIGPVATAVGTSSFAAGHGADAQGFNSIAIGAGAVASEQGSISMGDRAGENSTGYNATLIGALAGQDSAGIYNTGVGSESGSTVTGNYNTAIGPVSGRFVTGDNNSAMGFHAGETVTGANNVAVGQSAGSNVMG
ncbi:MAG: hypothetical protein EON92_12460, partial [Burkholderiales bacterium]